MLEATHSRQISRSVLGDRHCADEGQANDEKRGTAFGFVGREGDWLGLGHDQWVQISLPTGDPRCQRDETEARLAGWLAYCVLTMKSMNSAFPPVQVFNN